MLTSISKKNGEIEQTELSELLGNLEDGKYLIKITRINDEKTVESYSREYFAMLDVIRDHTGNDRYVLHAAFKKHEGVETTKDFGEKDWLKFLDELRWWAFKEFDLAI